MGLALGLGLGIPFASNPSSGLTSTAIAAMSPFAWYEVATANLYQDSGRTTPVTASGDPVGSVTDLSGNSRHLPQATSSSRPVFRTGNYLEFDGVDDRLRVTYTNVNQPITRINVFRQITWTSGDYVLGDGAGSTSVVGSILQNPTTPGLRASPNTTINLSGTAALGTTSSLVEVYNGASSRFLLNGTETTGNAGVLPSAGITIGANGSASNLNNGNIYWYGGIQFSRLLTDLEITQLVAYFMAKAGA